MTDADTPPAADEGVRPSAGAGVGRGGRIALVAAGAIAVAAIGVTAMRGQKQEAAVVEPPAASASQAPAVDDVIAKLEQRLQTNPDDAEGWRMLGWSYFQTERYAEAATALRKATRLDQRHAETFSFLGEALVLASNEEGRIPRDAQIAFNRALQLDPSDPRARYFKAVAMDLAGRHRQAINAWFDLLADTPADAPYAEDIREVIRSVGEKHKIDVEKRLAEARFAPPAAGMTTDGPQIAAAGIPGPTAAEMKAAAALPKGQQEAMIRGMVDGLDARLKANPTDADGWIMLMRSRMQLGEPKKAGKALQDGLAAFRNDSGASRRLREAATRIGVPAV